MLLDVVVGCDDQMTKTAVRSTNDTSSDDPMVEPLFLGEC